MPPELPTLNILLPLDRAGERLDPAPGEPVLQAFYAHPEPAPGRSTAVRANMIATLDGSAQGPDGRSRSINGPADWRTFRVQRSVADVVLVGAGTARDEGYGPLRVPADLRAAREQRGQGPLALAVVSRSGDLPEGLRGRDGDDRPYLVTCEDSPRLDAMRAELGADRVLVCGASEVDPGRALDALAALGMTRVLAEGGPGLLGHLLAEQLVDELCLSWSPLVVGGHGMRPVRHGEWLDPVLSGAPAHLLHHQGMLLGRWLLRADQAAGR